MKTMGILLMVATIFLAACESPRPLPHARPIVESPWVHFGEIRWFSTSMIVAESEEGVGAGLHGVYGGRLVVIDKRSGTIDLLGPQAIWGRRPAPYQSKRMIAYLHQPTAQVDRYSLISVYSEETGKRELLATGVFDGVE